MVSALLIVRATFTTTGGLQETMIAPIHRFALLHQGFSGRWPLTGGQG